MSTEETEKIEEAEEAEPFCPFTSEQCSGIRRTRIGITVP
jgi:hypothetical protein